MNQVRWRTLFLLFVFSFLLSACSRNQESGISAGTTSSQQTQKPIPVTLKIYTNEQKVNMDLESTIIQEKFPYITLDIAYSGDTTISKLITAGETPDVIQFTLGSFWTFKDLSILTDLNPLIKEFKFDSNRFLPNVLNSVQSYSDSGEILFMPYSLSTDVLYYNKDIFDKFGVPYPTDGMTWEEVYSLAKKLTRESDGIKYKGFQFQNQHMVWKNQLLLPLVDPNTHKTLVNNSGWKQWMETMGGFYRIPGNEYGGNFYRDLNIAMYTGPNQIANLVEAEKQNNINWDVVTLPGFKGNQSMGTQMISPFFSISPTSEHKREAFQMIDYMLSDEIQATNARNGIVPIIQSKQAMEQFGKDIEGLSGKNLGAFFKDPVGKAFRTTPYDDIAKTNLYKKVLPAYIEGEEDINTILRTAEEEVNASIQESLQQ